MAQGVTTVVGITATPPAQGPRLSFAAAAGAANDVNPGGGWPGLYGRLDVDTTAGAASWTGLLAGFDGQRIMIRNTGANSLTLNNQNAGSVAANRFASSGDTVIAAGLSVEAVYYAGSVNRWVIAT